MFDMQKTFVQKHWYLILTLLILVHLALLSNTLFTAWPEMMNWPYLINKTFVPYTDIAIAHNPLLILILANYYKMVGYDVSALIWFTWVVVLLTDIVLFWVAQKLYGKVAALISLLIYIPLQVFYQGNGIWFDLFLVPFILITYYLTVNKKYFAAGFVFAISFLIKQTAFWFLPAILLLISKFEVISPKQIQKMIVPNFKKYLEFSAGIVAVLVPFILLLSTYGMFSDYYNWAIKFGIFTLPFSKGQISPPELFQLVYSLLPFLILVIVFVFGEIKQKPAVLFAVFGLMSAFPRFELFHFQPAIPFLCLGVVLLPEILKKSHTLKLLFAGLVIVNSALVSIAVFGKITSGFKIRFVDKSIMDLAAIVNLYTGKGEQTYFLNLWENMYPLTDTVPATKPLVPHLSWYMERSGIQEEIVNNLSFYAPEYIYVGEFSTSGLSSYKPETVLRYIYQYYEVSANINGVNIYKKI